MRVTGYSDRISVAAGDTIRFMVSCDEHQSYRADLVRVICGDCNPDGPGFREEVIACDANGTYNGRHQPIRAGSYVRTTGSPDLSSLQGFTVAAMIWPTTPKKGEQVIVSCWSAEESAGFELLIDRDGALALRLGNGTGSITISSTETELLPEHWYLVAASVGDDGKSITLRQQRQVPYARLPTIVEAQHTGSGVATGHEPILIAARRSADTEASRMATEAHYNGKIDSPRLFAGVASFEDVAQSMQKTLPPHLRTSLLAAWDFSQDIPTQHVTDISGNGLHGETINLPARAMTGHNWSGDYRNWRNAPHEYGAIHFHDDDIYDAGWESDFEFSIPNDLRSGNYAMRLCAGEDEEYIPFFVRRPVGRPSAKILYLAQTATYMAYANLSFVFGAPAAELLANRLIIVQPWEQHLNLNPELGASLYDAHSDGSGICYSSRLRPILNMRPKAMTSTAGVGSMLWGYNADTHLTDWLEAKGYEFDVATDEDLHADGAALLRHYKVVITGTHPEYYSTTMLDSLQAYTAAGGRLMYMGGNGFYWRIAYHPTLPGVIEVRRAEDGTRAWKARPGEFHHSFNGEYGGMWRSQGRAPQQLVGTGFIAQGFDLSSPYRRTPQSNDPRVAFAVEGIDDDETIGGFGLIGGGAAGLEVDIADPAMGTPPHTVVVAHSDALPDTFLLVNEEQLIATPDTMGSSNPRIRSDLAFHETGNGGGVFAFSSMAWCGSLSHDGYDNNVSRMTANVLNRFLSDDPL